MSSSTPTAPKRARDGPAASSSSLRDKLAAILPQGHRFGIHHVSTPPTKTESLCPAPPGERPDKTYREQHFLAISIYPQSSTAAPLKRASPGADHLKDSDGARKPLLVFSIEVFIFTTAYQTTFFVSKVDSTGYLHLLNLPKGAASPIRQVCATFLTYLLNHRRRNHVQSVVNLFARAQAQYLFPGSVRNSGKHVLDDWGLVRWWCKTLNPLLEGSPADSWQCARGYLLVPGLEEQEARSLIPRTTGSPKNWVVGHPLERISHYTRDVGSVPPRCLIPGYPDDPKSRFRDELDEEVSKRRQSVSAWKSVKTLDQFWEMMAFRQECSSGRLTGFIWLVFDSDQLKETHPQASVLRDAAASSSKSAASPAGPNSSRSSAAKRKGKPKRKGPIATRAPRIKTHSRNYRFAGRTTTAYYSWPVEGRGAKIVNESEYKRIVELLLHLDFSTLDKAIGSSQRWIGEVDAGASWDGEVVGTAPLHVPNLTGGSNVASAGVGGGGDGDGKVANLTGTGLIRRKKGSEVSGGEQLEVAERISGGATAGAVTEGVNLLGANLVRKKKKGSDGQ